MLRALVLACALAVLLPVAASARPAPVTWCGSDESSANREPDLEPTSSDQIRFVYAIPSDGADSFLADASGIATDAAWIDQWWQGQDPTRTPRFRRTAFPGCTTRFGGLDIGFVRLPRDAATYAAGPTPGDSLDDDLRGLFPADQKTIVYYDGPVGDDTVCGEAPESPHEGGDDGIALVYLQSSCDEQPPGTTGSAEVATHELLHDLGAVPSEAPHWCESGHVCDSTSDVLAAFYNDGSTLDDVSLDVGRDDYYGHGGSWWDTQDSDWLMHLPQHPLTLALSAGGSLSASVDGSPLPCDAGCSQVTLDDGAGVTVVATPAPGFRLGGWSGACSGTAPTCDITLADAATATATFVRAAVRITVAVRGRGRVTSAPHAIACPHACSRAFASGTSVRLRARPAKGWRFAGWTGACRGRGVCTVPAARARSVAARFVRVTK